MAYRPALLLCISSHPIHHCASVSTSSPLSHQPAIDLLLTPHTHAGTLILFDTGQTHTGTVSKCFCTGYSLFQIAHNQLEIYWLNTFKQTFWKQLSIISDRSCKYEVLLYFHVENCSSGASKKFFFFSEYAADNIYMDSYGLVQEKYFSHQLFNRCFLNEEDVLHI